ncbi:unnamed protein product [Miscanthus lutarioriparius]|uniref:HAT transposon superfamily protein n=1 Tax=Miscanthus lutarioriparius TaxID=422564 RepID=A0A811QXC9_9POAL|nr:unnamed protein product [Miscanthus lutarioriparius]
MSSPALFCSLELLCSVSLLLSSPLFLKSEMTETEGQPDSGSATAGGNVLRRNSDDVGWEFGVLVNPNNKDQVKCILCDKVMFGGVYRLKQHIALEGKNAKKCQGTKTSKEKLKEAQQKCKKALDEAKRKREEKTVREIELREEVHVSRVGTSEEVTCVGSSEPHKLGPMDKWTKAIDPTATKSESLTQQKLNKKLWKERLHEVHKYIARWAYNHEMSDVSHTSEVIFELVDKAIEDIGEDDVVQVVTDNASNNMGAKKLLHEKRPQIFWTSCAAHTINLMLQGIGNIPRFKKLVDQAKAFTIFVYGHTRTLECMRYFTEGREIVRPGVTRFASNFLTLESIQEKKDQLRKMVVHSRWDSLKDVKSQKGKNATATISNPNFWKDVKLTLAVFEPLFKVLRLVDGDVKPSMGFVYGELLKAKRKIKEALCNVESRFKDVIDIVEKKMAGRLDSPLHLTAYLLNPHYSYADPSIFDVPKITEGFISCVETFYYHDEEMQEQAANVELQKFQSREGPLSKKLARTFENFDYNLASWWRLYGTETPALQKMATRILSLTASSSGCERNWVHTKKRNRLTVDRLNKLVYIQFNNRLLNKRAKIKSKKITDVLLSSDTTEAQGFLQENGDDLAVIVFRDDEDEELMKGTGIPWSVLGDAVGAEEQLELRRSARVRELYEGEEFQSEEEEFDEDEDDYMMDD